MDFFRQMNRRTVAAAAVSAALLVPLGVFGAPALAGSNGPSAAQYQYKVAVCHRTHSKKHPWHKITVGAPAVKAHLKHGDFVIDASHPCPPAGAVTAGTSTQGQSGKHDNGHHGNPNANANPGNGNGKAKGHGK
jgi:hypothetical protein